jgi:heme-degrading monooxygenase HmoA
MSNPWRRFRRGRAGDPDPAKRDLFLADWRKQAYGEYHIIHSSQYIPCVWPDSIIAGFRKHSSRTQPKEADMTVRVLIKRVVPREKAKEMIPLFRQMRQLATNQPGYISGETLKSLDRPDVFLVISTWLTSGEWEKWLLSKERREIQAKVDALLGGKTEYEMFQVGTSE